MSTAERIRLYRDLAGRLGQAAGSAAMVSERSASERAYWAGMQWCLGEEGDAEAAEQITLAMGADCREVVRSQDGGSLLASHWPCVQQTKNRDAKQQMIEAGESLAELFQRRNKYFCLEGDTETVRIESLLATPLVFYAANETLEQELGRRATQHARTVRNHLVQAEGAVARAFCFDEQAASPTQPTTDLVAAAIAMFGFTQCFAFTNQTEFLTVAETNADYWLTQLEKLDELDGIAAAWGAASLLSVALESRNAVRAAAWRAAGLQVLDRLVENWVFEQWQQQRAADQYPLVVAVTTAIRGLISE